MPSWLHFSRACIGRVRVGHQRETVLAKKQRKATGDLEATSWETATARSLQRSISRGPRLRSWEGRSPTGAATESPTATVAASSLSATPGKGAISGPIGGDDPSGDAGLQAV